MDRAEPITEDLTQRKQQKSLVDQPISKIVNRELLFCGPDERLSEAAHLMQENGCSSIIVQENEIPIGIWTERDALAIDCSNLSALDQPIRSFMRSPVKTINHDVSVGASAVRFKEEGVRHLLVVDDASKTIGIITQTDVILKHGVEYYLGVKDVHSALTVSAPKVLSTAPIGETVAAIRASKQSAVCVEFGPKDYGIITDKDITHLIAEKIVAQTAADIATRNLVTIQSSASLLEARNKLAKHGFRHIGVLDQESNLIGLLSYSGILNALQYEYLKQIDTVLEERDRALRQFQSNLRLAHKIIESSLDGVILLNREGIIEYVNPTFTSVTGFTSEEAVGKTPAILKSGRHDDEYYKQMWEVLAETGYWQGEIWNRRKNGAIYPEWLTITVIRDEAGKIQQYAGIFCDISDRKEKEQAIRKMAFFDDLTGLPNRRLFRDRLMVALARAKRHNEYLAIMFLDLDHFKKINDNLGHVIGDTLLVEASQRIKECLREEDTVARLGGDEFILLFPDIENIDEIVKIAERVNHSFNEPFKIGDNQLYVTSSIGISVFPNDGNDADSLIKNADAAMYRSKDEGRNKFNLFSPVFTAHGKRHLQLEHALRNALKKDELALVYQPKVRASTGELVGLEALARWENEELGFVSPVEFIPLAESIGLIGEFGTWALKSACKTMRQWKKEGHPPVSIAVNISAIQLVENTFPQNVASILAEYEIEAQNLEIEITESTFLKDFDIVRSNLEALKQLGVSIAMDDFGTGFSSLSYLNRIPLDYLKIDRSFVSKMFLEDESLELVATIIAMAKNLGLKTIAEGVEDEDQATLLDEKGCNLLQGYLYSQPIPPEKIVEKYWR